jgi:hypothetical protein
MPFCKRMGIETHRHMGRFLIGDQVHQGIGKSKLGVGIPAFGSNTGIAN